MYVVCPSCQDVFKIYSGHLAVAQGHVRCGACLTVFDATASLYDTLDEAGTAAQRLRAAEQDISGVVDVALARMDQSAPVSDIPAIEPETVEAHGVSESTDDNIFGVDSDFYAQPVAQEFTPLVDVPVPLVAVALDEEPEERVAGISSNVWWGVAASVFLSFLITGQYVWKERYQLAADAQLRPWMERYCALLRCDLPLRSDPKKIAILDREVRDHPRVKDALLVSATILNDAPFTQTYPVFMISFSDTSGTPVTVRRFEPEEYLSDDKDVGQGFKPGEKTQLVLEVLDPGKKAVSFQFDFL
jgi:predicted Zn finger-like uncharacterized protein